MTELDDAYDFTNMLLGNLRYAAAGVAIAIILILVLILYILN